MDWLKVSNNKTVKQTSEALTDVKEHKRNALVAMGSRSQRRVGSAALRKNGRSVRRTVAQAGVPRQILLWSTVSTTLRFNGPNAALTTSSGLVTIDDIFCAILVIGRVANTSVTQVATSFRLRRVTIYVSGTTQGTVDASVIWFGDNLDHEPDQERVNATQANVWAPMSVTSVPPRNSGCGLWIRNTASPVNTAVFCIQCTNSYPVVDVDLDWTLPTGVVSQATRAVATAAVGTVYRLALNSTNGSSALLTPALFNTTT